MHMPTDTFFVSMIDVRVKPVALQLTMLMAATVDRSNIPIFTKLMLLMLKLTCLVMLNTLSLVSPPKNVAPLFVVVKNKSCSISIL